MTLTDATTAADTGLPAPGTYEIDPSHTHVGFAVKHMGLARTRGEFRAVSGEVVIAEDPADSSVTAEIDAASFSTGDDTRDGHVRSAELLDIEQFPTLGFRSTGLRQDGDDWHLDGELTVKGVTRPVSLEVAFEGQALDPYQLDRLAFSATTNIDRTDFGVHFEHVLDGGGLVVGRKVQVTLDIEATRPAQ